MSIDTYQQAGTVLLSAAIVIALVPGLAMAQTGPSGTVIVEEGETVSTINAVSGSVIVRGTVTGNVEGVAGSVEISGTVEGDVSVATGDLVITGNVDGDVSAGAGQVTVADGASIGGDLDVGAGTVRIDGTIEGNMRAGAETIQLGETAVIAGSLTYDGTLEGNREAVAGSITQDSAVGATSVGNIQPVLSLVVTAYAFVANVLLGAALLLLFPQFSTVVPDRVLTNPVRTGAIGFGVLVGGGILLAGLAITIIGIPLAIAGGLLFTVVFWIGLVYGRLTLGIWILSVIWERDTIRQGSRQWIALVIGLAFGGALTILPIVGDVLNLVIIFLGVGGLASVLYTQQAVTTNR